MFATGNIKFATKLKTDKIALQIYFKINRIKKLRCFILRKDLY